MQEDRYFRIYCHDNLKLRVYLTCQSEIFLVPFNNNCGLLLFENKMQRDEKLNYLTEYFIIIFISYSFQPVSIRTYSLN